MKRVFFVALLSLFLFKPADAQNQKTSHFQINPLIKYRITESELKSRTSKSKAAVYECTSYNDLVSLITEKSKLRTTTYSIHLSYNFLFSNVQSIISQAIYDATISDDYLLFSYAACGYEWIGTNNDVTIDFEFSFLTTLSNEQYVSFRIAYILGQIITDDMTDLEKEKTVYDWIIRNVQYDFGYEYYSAYDALYRGTTVCNGYALLMYKMLNALGMTVRIAPGYGGDGLHAWNMVYLCGNWYHADATWDDPNTANDLVNYTYFNLSDAEITSKDHTIGALPNKYKDVPEAPVSFDGIACSQYTHPGSKPDTPALLLPLSSSTAQSLTPILIAGAFADPDPMNSHMKTLWQISLDAAFSNCIYYDTSTEYLTTFAIPSEASLPDNTTFYWRVRYFDSSGGVSAWSETRSFTTAKASPTTVPTANDGGGSGCFISSLRN